MHVKHATICTAAEPLHCSRPAVPTSNLEYAMFEGARYQSDVPVSICDRNRHHRYDLLVQELRTVARCIANCPSYVRRTLHTARYDHKWLDKFCVIHKSVHNHYPMILLVPLERIEQLSRNGPVQRACTFGRHIAP